MTLLAPGWLALLLLAGPLLLLHMRSRRRVKVSSLLLWQGVAATVRPHAALKKPPLSAMLLLQLLALVLVALLLARPVFPGAQQVEHLIVLLDGGLQQNDPDRLSASLGVVQRELAALRGNPNARWSLVVVGKRPVPVVARWKVEDTDVSYVLSLVEVTDASADWRRAAEVAARLSNAGELTHAVLVGAGELERAVVEAVLDADDASAQANPATRVAARHVSMQSSVFIVDASVEPVPGARSGTWRVRGSVTGVGGWPGEHVAGAAGAAAGEREPNMVRIGVEFVTDTPGNGRSGVIEAPLAAGEAEFEALLELPGSGVLTLDLSSGNGVPATFVLVDQAQRLPVLYMGPGNPALRRALEATGYVELTEVAVVPGARASVPPATDWALVILDRVRATSMPAASTLWIGSEGLTTHLPGAQGTSGLPADPRSDTVARPLSNVQVTWWNTGHDLVARTDWSSLTFGDVWTESLGAAAVDLVNAVGAPISGSAGSDGRSADTHSEELSLVQILALPTGLHVNLNFDIEGSDWPQRNGFPLFVRSLLEQIDPAAGHRVMPACSAGNECRLPAGVQILKDPAGTEIGLPRLRHGQVETVESVFVPARAGLYSLELPSGSVRRLAVNVQPDSTAFMYEPASTQPPAGTDSMDSRSKAAWLTARTTLTFLLLLTLLAEGLLASSQAGRHGLQGTFLRGVALVLAGSALFGLRLPLPAFGSAAAVVVPGPPWLTGELPEWADVPPQLAALRAEPRVAVIEGQAQPDLQLDLALALATLPAGVPAQVITVGDGAQASGDYVHMLHALADRGVDAQVVHLGRSPLGEVQVTSVTPPPLVRAGDRFVLRVELHAATAGEATLTTYRNEELVGERSVVLPQGSSLVEVEAYEPVVGVAAYRVEVVADDDVFTDNNSVAAVIEIVPAGRVLLVSDDQEWGSLLQVALSGQGMHAALISPGQFPTGTQSLLEYQAVVLANVPAAALLGEQLSLLEEAVSAHGISLLLLGGEASFGPGGYYETPLERMSPASSLVPRQAPELAIAFVVDRSNSMRQYAGDEVRLEIAKSAVLRAYDLLPEGARAALIAFDSTARTLVPLGGADQAEAFRAAVLALEPRGGTAIYPGLEEAYAQLSGNGASSSHVIVMGDGLSQPGDFAGILALLRAEGITVSTIGIGPEADAEQLRHIAQLGGGSFHFSADFASLPGIMAHEVLLQTGDLTEERDTAPVWHDNKAAFLRAWPAELPQVAGFVPTSLKPGAAMHLSVTTDEGNEVPLLASWRYGAGQVVAFTAHGAGPWTSEWLDMPQFPTLWSHLLRQVDGNPEVVQLPQRDAAQTAYRAAFDLSLADPERLAAAVQAIGGSALFSLADFESADSWYLHRAPAWPWLLLAALLVLFVELTLRYAPDLLLTRRRKE